MVQEPARQVAEAEEGGAGAHEEAAGGAQREEDGGLPAGRGAGHPPQSELQRGRLVRPGSGIINQGNLVTFGNVAETYHQCLYYNYICTDCIVDLEDIVYINVYSIFPIPKQ